MNNYKQYLKSEDWKTKKTEKYSKTKKRCGICGSKEDVDLHHLNYKNLLDVESSDLRALCRRCHFLAHDLIKNGKIVFKSDNHHSRFAIIKYQVKKELGIENLNMFNDRKTARS